jgi:hypothetical protein
LIPYYHMVSDVVTTRKSLDLLDFSAHLACECSVVSVRPTVTLLGFKGWRKNGKTETICERV